MVRRCEIPILEVDMVHGRVATEGMRANGPDTGPGAGRLKA